MCLQWQKSIKKCKIVLVKNFYERKERYGFKNHRSRERGS